MKRLVEFLKATVLGGVVFLVPVIAIVYVVGKALVLSRRLADPLVTYLPVSNIAGIAIADVIGLTAIALACFFAGLLARNSLATAVVREAEARFLWKVPGYGMLKGLSESFSEEGEMTMKPVVARLDDAAQVGFEIERLADGRVVVYLPGAPDAWSGSIMIMTDDRIEPLPVTVVAVVQSMRALGRGTRELVEGSA